MSGRTNFKESNGYNDLRQWRLTEMGRGRDQVVVLQPSSRSCCGSRVVKTSRCATWYDRSRTQRGYSIQRAREIMQRYTWQCKHDILHKKHATEGNKPRVVPFKVPYSDGMATLNIGRIIQHHVGLLVNPLRDFLKPLVCYTSGCSLFRKRYNRFR